MKMNTKTLARIAIIAAVYTALTIGLAPLSYGLIQFRVAEAMTILPFLFPQSMYGLFIGCLLANIFSGMGLIDIVFGSLATLIAGFLTSKTKNKWLAPLPPVLVNAVIIGGVLAYVLEVPFIVAAASVGIGQLGACYLLGMPLLLFLQKSATFQKYLK